MKLNQSDIFRILASLLAFVLLIVLFVREISYNINTFNRFTVVLISVAVGFAAGILLALYLRKYSDELFGKFQIFVSLAVLGAFIFPALISMANRAYVTETNEQLVYIETDEVYGMMFKGSLPDNGEIEANAYDITVERESGNRETVRFPREVSAEWETGQIADITVYRGLFNIHFIYPE